MDKRPIINPIRFWCHKILPLVYDDALSYYEVLCKLAAKMNEVINAQNELQDALTEAFNQYTAEMNQKFEDYTAETNAKYEAFIQQLESDLAKWKDGIESDWLEFEATINNDMSAYKNLINADMDAFKTATNNTVNAFTTATNKTIADMQAAIEAFEKATNTTVQNLTNFVNNYFDNLDVQDEINNKLDDMAASGELQTLLLDPTLTKADRAAPAKTVGDKTLLYRGVLTETNMGLYLKPGTYSLSTATLNALTPAVPHTGLYHHLVAFNHGDTVGNDNQLLLLRTGIYYYLNINNGVNASPWSQIYPPATTQDLTNTTLPLPASTINNLVTGLQNADLTLQDNIDALKPVNNFNLIPDEGWEKMVAGRVVRNTALPNLDMGGDYTNYVRPSNFYGWRRGFYTLSRADVLSLTDITAAEWDTRSGVTDSSASAIGNLMIFPYTTYGNLYILINNALGQGFYTSSLKITNPVSGKKWCRLWQ